MANSSIPNSTPATGQTSTTSSRRSRKQNSVAALLAEVVGLVKADPPRALRFFHIQRSTLSAQHSIQTVGRWMLDVGRWTFSFLWRVKGAWWPSRSSKPSPPRKWRGRFDSYPLRLDCSTFNAQRSTLNVQFRQLSVGCWTLSVGRFLLLNSERR
jgi:hypothetical protein